MRGRETRSESESSDLEIIEGSEGIKEIDQEISEIEIEFDSSSELSVERNEEKKCFVINLKEPKYDKAKNMST